jgi:hypothetical protein
MRVSYIIHYRHSQEKLLLLRKVLEWAYGFQNLDIIIVEQDIYSKISHLNLGARHFFIKNPNRDIYNKSWAFNYVLKRQSNPICVFADCDVIMDPKDFATSLMEIQNFDVVKPYNNLINLGPGESNLSIVNLKNIQRKDTNPQLCSGITIFKTESILKLGGWSEVFETLGNDDLFQEEKVKKLEITYKEMPNSAYHLFHQKSISNEITKKKSDMYLEQLMGLDMIKLQGHIGAVIPKIGMANKYC